jgi:hypothetical protein
MTTSYGSWRGTGHRLRSYGLRCGNSSNAYLRRLLADTLQDVLDMLSDGEPLVEIADPWRQPRRSKP